MLDFARRSASKLQCAAICLALWTVGAAAFAIDVSDLISRLPEDANALIVINADAIFESAVAQREGWREKYANAFEATPLVLPPTAKMCVLGAEFDITSMHPLWEAAVMELSIDPTAQQVADRLGGVVDKIGSFDAVWTPSKACVLKLAANEYGVMAPVSRQGAARWAANVEQPSSDNLSAYLQTAAGYVDANRAEVLMAIDLQHSLRPEDVAAAVEKSNLFKDLPRDEVAAVLSSIVGVKLGVVATDQLSGRLIIDFGKDASVLRPVAKQLVLSILSGAGAMLDEFQQWTANVDGASLALHGELTTDGMRRLFSLLTLDASVVDRPANRSADSPGEASADNQIARNSLRYFRGVAKYVDDLNRLQRARSIDQAILWINNYARKIDRLPTKDVDADLIQYGRSVSDRFRQIVATTQGVYQRAEQSMQELPDGSTVTVGALPTWRTINYGGYVSREYVPYAKAQIDVGAARRQRQVAQEEVQKAIDSATSALQQIVSDTAQIRQTMSQRYGVKF